MSHTSSTVTVRLPEDWMNPTSAVSMWLLEAGVQQQSSKYLSEVVSETIVSVSDELRRRRILFVVLEVFETLATTAALQALIVSLAPTVSPPWPQQPEVLQVPLQAPLPASCPWTARLMPLAVRARLRGAPVRARVQLRD